MGPPTSKESFARDNPTRPLSIRRAVVEDAQDITLLYVQAYTPSGGGDPRLHYPFPQIFHAEWVADAVVRDSIAWCVAEDAGRVVASAAALRNIGGPLDQIAEVFGIVVSDSFRRRGVGTQLLRFLCNELAPTARFILCEARTAEPGGWKSARNCGFMPIGFEPFAHAMPVGFESMLLTARFGVGDDRAIALNTSFLAPTGAADAECILSNGIEVCRDDAVGRRLLEQLPGMDFRSSPAVVDQSPLEGQDLERVRYDRLFYVARRDSCLVGVARVIWDRVDCRARLLGLHTFADNVEAPFLSRIAEALCLLAGSKPLTILTILRSDALASRGALERLEFFPTAYYPGLVANDKERVDAIQYTFVKGNRLEDSSRFVTDIDWLPAKEFISRFCRVHRIPFPDES